MSSDSFQEYIKFVNEINQGMEQVKQLRASCSPNQEAALDKMVASYTEAASLLNGGSSQGQSEAETRQVYSSSTEDGYSWRKYGQKAILGAIYPRCYFRCIHKYTQNCAATKIIEKTCEAPPTYRIFYRMLHTCRRTRRAQSTESLSCT